MTNNTMVVGLRPWMVTGALSKFARRVSYRMRDIGQIYSFWRDGYRVHITRDGWYVELNTL